MGYRGTVEVLANEIRRLTPACSLRGRRLGAETLLAEFEEVLFTHFCAVLGGNNHLILVKKYMLPGSGRRNAQTLYYIAGWLAFRMAAINMRRCRDEEHRAWQNRSLGRAMEYAQVRAHPSGDPRADGDTAVASGMSRSLVQAVLARHTRTGPTRGNEDDTNMPAVFASVNLYRFVCLLEANAVVTLTVGFVPCNQNETSLRGSCTLPLPEEALRFPKQGSKRSCPKLRPRKPRLGYMAAIMLPRPDSTKMGCFQPRMRTSSTRLLAQLRGRRTMRRRWPPQLRKQKRRRRQQWQWRRPRTRRQHWQWRRPRTRQ